MAQHLPELLTAREAADALRVSTQTIRTWIKAGQLDGVRVGREFRVNRHAVAKLAGADEPTEP